MFGLRKSARTGRNRASIRGAISLRLPAIEVRITRPITTKEGSNMRIAIFAAMAVLLTGCVTGAVTSVGKDTYTMSASRCGICEPVQGYVTSKAGAYCNSIGKNLVVRGVTGNNVQPWAPEAPRSPLVVSVVTIPTTCVPPPCGRTTASRALSSVPNNRAPNELAALVA
jgi:hypothetical protein